MTKKRKKILLVGGGTGGHAVPVFLVYENLKAIDDEIDITIVGSGSTIEKHIFVDVPVYRTICAGKLRRHLTSKNIVESILAMVGFIQAFFILLFNRPQVIFSKGGYVAVPVLTWAKILGIPYIIHESDTSIGLGNKIAIKKARKVFVAFPKDAYHGLPKDRISYNTPIVRKGISDTPINKDNFGFDNNNPVIFITGGSQGSHNINETIIHSIKELLAKYNIIHQTGDLDYQNILGFKNTLDEPLKRKYYVADFLKVEGDNDRMLQAIILADLVIARAGATTIFELAVAGKPTILIPWKHSSSNHQAKNAEIIKQAGGAIVIDDDDLTPDLIVNTVTELISDQNKLESLSKNIKSIFQQDGLEQVCREIIEVVER